MTDIVERLRVCPEHVLIARLGDIRPGAQLEKSLEHQAADEIQRLRTIIRVNGLRWGVPNAEIDALLYPEKRDD